MARHRLIIGLDFGTTFTGISYVDSKQETVKEVTVLRKWPGLARQNESLDKVPSLIAYRSENKQFDRTDDVFGYDVEPAMTAYSWFKLRLDWNTVINEYDAPKIQGPDGESRDIELPPGKDAKETVTDFLRLIYRHLISELELTYPPSTLRLTPFEIWITYPAMWSDEAQDATLQAAKAAGFGSRDFDVIRTIPEPEAAAIAALKNSAETLKVDTGIMVCDCGGGTVDLTTFVVTQASPTVKLEESCVPRGGKCGATFVDRNFFKLMSDRYGPSFTSLPKSKTGVASRFMREWESIKKNYSMSARSRTFKVPLIMRDFGSEGTITNGYEYDEGEVAITSDDLKNCFDPVIAKVLALVSQQVESVKKEENCPHIKSLVLVGGFGSSPYLWQKLREWCIARGIHPIIAQQSWSAISRGAALRGFEGVIVGKRKCQRHYGIEIGVPFRDGDPPESMWENKFENEKVTTTGIEWHVAKNQNITTNSVEKFKVELHLNFSSASRHATLDLYSCSYDQAPDRTYHPMVIKEGTLHIDFKGIDISKVPSVSAGFLGLSKHRKIPLEIEMKVGGDRDKFSYTVTCQGKAVGSAVLEFVHN